MWPNVRQTKQRVVERSIVCVRSCSNSLVNTRWHIAADGATIIAANKEARKPDKTVDGDDDSYM